MPAHDPYAPARTAPVEEIELTRRARSPLEVDTTSAAEPGTGLDYEDMRRDQLIEIAHARGLVAWGTKRQLVQRLQAYDRR